MIKSTLFVMITLSLLLLNACKKNADKVPKGEVHALFNGAEWNAEPIAYKSKFGKDNLIDFVFYVNRGLDNEQAQTFTDIRKQVGKQRLYKIDYTQNPEILHSSYYTSQEYDVTGDEYTIVESDSVNNWIKITSAEDNFTKEIRGEFSASFVRTKTFLNSPYPDTVRFRNGTFYISKIKE